MSKHRSVRPSPPQTIIFRDIKYHFHGSTDSASKAEAACKKLRASGYRVRKQIKFGINLIYISQKA